MCTEITTTVSGGLRKGFHACDNFDNGVVSLRAERCKLLGQHMHHMTLVGYKCSEAMRAIPSAATKLFSHTQGKLV